MKIGKYLILRDKQFYTTDMKLMGNSVEVAKQLAKDYDLLHIRDMDMDRGVVKNLDVYDKLTYYINVQVEVHREIDELRRLVDFQVRLVAIPGIAKRIDLYKAIIISRYEDLIEQIRDVVVTDRSIIDMIGARHRIMTLGFRDERAFLAIDR